LSGSAEGWPRQNAGAAALSSRDLTAWRPGPPIERVPPIPLARLWLQAAVAQLAEQRTFNPKVVGSIPTGGIGERLEIAAFLPRAWVFSGNCVPNMSRGVPGASRRLWPDVLVAVADVDDPTLVVWKPLKAVLPDYWRTAFPDGLDAGWND
jgi:hypothetical protein